MPRDRHRQAETRARSVQLIRDCVMVNRTCKAGIRLSSHRGYSVGLGLAPAPSATKRCHDGPMLVNRVA